MDLIGKNGKIDGILAAQVLLDGGVFFFKPGELYYDGTYHQVKGMQANTTAMRDFPGIFDKMGYACAGISQFDGIYREEHDVPCQAGRFRRRDPRVFTE